MHLIISIAESNFILFILCLVDTLYRFNAKSNAVLFLSDTKSYLQAGIKLMFCVNYSIIVNAIRMYFSLQSKIKLKVNP